MSAISADLLVRGAVELCTMRGEASQGEAMVDIIRGGSLAARDGKVVWVGSDAELDRAVEPLPCAVRLDASGCTVTPGLVDSHTHVVFAGDRSDEFALRCAGGTYLEIAARGGGIGATVRKTRELSEDALVEFALPRLKRMLGFGITTAEAKSGYGLDLDSELKMLRAIGRLPKLQPIELVPTLLCAHAIPSEFANDRDGYVRLCVEEIVPETAQAGLARFCDAFVEKGAFSVGEGRAILGRAKELGMTPRLHADQMSSMGAVALAVELGAATADHLEYVTDDGIRAMAVAKVSAVLLPASTLFLKQQPWAPGRKLWDAGVNVGLATNLNPGSATSENPYLALTLACLYNGLTPSEALWAFTRGSARAIGLGDRVGVLAPGMQADLVIHACESHKHLAYHMAASHVRTVVKHGRVVLETAVDRCRA